MDISSDLVWPGAMHSYPVTNERHWLSDQEELVEKSQENDCKLVFSGVKNEGKIIYLSVLL